MKSLALAGLLLLVVSQVQASTIDVGTFGSFDGVMFVNEGYPGGISPDAWAFLGAELYQPSIAAAVPEPGTLALLLTGLALLRRRRWRCG